MCQLPMPDSVRHHLVNEMIGQEIRANGKVFQVLDVLGGGNTAVTFEVQDEYTNRWALKLVTKESYGERAPMREVERLTSVADKRFLAFPEEVDDWEYEGTGFVCFKARCVAGPSLEQFLGSDVTFDACQEIDLFLTCLTAALGELRKVGYSHGDLHWRNIIREEIGQDGPCPAVQYVLIDFSDSHEVDAPELALKADLESLGQHLRAFSDAINRREPLTRDDEHALSAIGHLPGLLVGGPEEAAPPMTPEDVLTRFRAGIRSAVESRLELRDPFDCLSAEDIASDSLLAELCFMAHWWVSDLQGGSNILLIGPRGCGKTMIFRRLRLKTKAAAGLAMEINADDYVAFYIPCESVFYLRFADLTDAMIERHERQLISFFNMAVLAEVASVVDLVAGELSAVPRTLSRVLMDFVRSEFDDGALDLASEVRGLGDVAHAAKVMLIRIREGIGKGNPIQSAGRIDFVARLVETVKKQVPGLAARRFLFLLDDYTDDRVPIRLQRSLHPIVSQRSADLSFKLSAHMFGSMYCHPHNLAIDEGRNMLVVNIGHEYLNPDRKKAERECLVKILNARIRKSPTHEGTIDEWLGESTYAGGSTLARALHNPTTRSQAYYHGIDCLVDLCSGDIAEMVRMVRAIFLKAGQAARLPDGARRTPTKIAARVQDEAITAVSRDLLQRVRHIPRYGPKLFEILNAFGTLSRRLLWEHPLVSQGKSKSGKARKEPYGLLTIYVDDLTRAQEYARYRWQLLQRAAIFIDIRTGRSQRQTIADRATLRRVYCPAFKTCLSSSEPLQLTRRQFDLFMDKPEEFCRKQFARRAKQDGGPQLFSEPPDMSGPENGNGETATLPAEQDRVCFSNFVGDDVASFSEELPALSRVQDAITPSSRYDLYIGALGFEDRTTCALSTLVGLKTQATNALLLEFDIHCEANEKHRAAYEELALALSGGRPYRPFNAPVATPNTEFMPRLTSRLKSIMDGERPRVLFDCTSCPSVILSQVLRTLLAIDCELTVLYSEAEDYYPTREEWESGKIKPSGELVRGPCYGFESSSKPTGLQADDLGEGPVALTIFPTFNTERTDGVLAELDPAERVWVFGKPHDESGNAYRYEMMVAMAAPLMHPRDPWTAATTFDYRAAFREMAGIYTKYRPGHRLVVLPHGSKMQTLGVGLFTLVHPVSLVFANPKSYNPGTYSRGCLERWCVAFGPTEHLRSRLRRSRISAAGGRMQG